MRSASLAALMLLLGIAASTPAWGQNLVVNGNFETGNSTGWTAWGAGWGSNDPPNYAATPAGRVGNYALRLGTAGQHSFGVYQQVAVTPGKSYKIDAYWKGRKVGGTNWYEILLLDGTWDPVKADSGTPANQVVEPNYMYAYDNNTYPLPADFGWIWAHDQNNTPVDWNDRDGVRTASGSTMTVVLKAGACCGTNGAEVWFDEVSLTEVTGNNPALGTCSMSNGDFANAGAGWTPWLVNNAGGDFSASVVSGEMTVGGANFNGGVYQVIQTGGAGRVVTVLGDWRSSPTAANAMYGEVWLINAARTPVDGVNEINGANNAVLLYRNDTFSGRGAWNNGMALSSPVTYNPTFVAAGSQATLILKAGNNGAAGSAAVKFDNVKLSCVPGSATLASPPAGFAVRSHTFPVTNMVALGQSPTSKLIYAISNEGSANNTRLYRINIGGGSITSTQIPLTAGAGGNAAVTYAQGMTFDYQGTMFISTQYGAVWKALDINVDDAVDDFRFYLIADMPDQQIGTFHGVGGIAVGPEPDLNLFINSGSESHYGYLPGCSEATKENCRETFAGRLNARIVTMDRFGGGSGVTSWAEGLRNSFDISYRADGKLFGVENGPNTNCDYAEEFNMIEAGKHYGFPYKYGSDISGSDSSMTCNNPEGGGVNGPPALPGGINPVPAWANYGPDAKPSAGQRGYSNGGPYYGFDPHSSPDGLDFYEPQLMDPQAIKFPASFHGRAFVARFGHLENLAAASNPNPSSVGFDLLTLNLDDAHQGFVCNRFLSGLKRPIDVLCAYNGKVYVLEYNQNAEFPIQSGWGANSKVHEIAFTIASAPQIVLNKSAINRTLDFGFSLSNDTFTVRNTGTGTLNYTVMSDQTWVQPSPTSGDSADGNDIDTITLTYTGVNGLPIGQHVAQVTVSDPTALNNPQIVTVTVDVTSVKPDFDKDGDVDMVDFSHLQQCYGPSGVSPPAGCEDARLDNDIDVDYLDLPIFIGCMSGANIPADPACDD